MGNYLIWDRIEGYAILSIDRPPMNALNLEVLTNLGALLAEHESDVSLKALIITGIGRAFVAGADIAAMSEMSVLEAQQFSETGQAVMEKVSKFPVPVIAAINGFALGGGLELALACDIRVGSTKAKVGQPEITLGIIPGFAGTARLVRAISPSKAKELLYTGAIIDSAESLALGLLDKVVEPEALMAEAIKLAQSISKNSGVVLRNMKKAISSGLAVDSQEEARMFAACFATEDQREGMKAFLEKRLPAFKNR
ncbi:MAG: enoyl-CoA hydratase-related protein [bacterium]|nr:enoyl-CoA hydratase-related protein [bacterium]